MTGAFRFRELFRVFARRPLRGRVRGPGSPGRGIDAEPAAESRPVLRPRRPDAQITAITAWRISNGTGPLIRIARAEAKRLALAVKDLPARLAENHKELVQLTEDWRRGFNPSPGSGP